MPKFKKNTSSVMKAQGRIDPDAMIARGKGAGPFQMKYQGNPAAFPFKYAGEDYKNIGSYIKKIQGIEGSGGVTTKDARKAQLKADFSKTKVGQFVKKVGSIFKK